MFGDIVFFCFFFVLISLLMLCYAVNLLMAFDRLLLKGLLTYLLTYDRLNVGSCLYDDGRIKIFPRQVVSDCVWPTATTEHIENEARSMSPSPHRL